MYLRNRTREKIFNTSSLGDFEEPHDAGSVHVHTHVEEVEAVRGSEQRADSIAYDSAKLQQLHAIPLEQLQLNICNDMRCLNTTQKL